MHYGLISGLLWSVDTVVLGIALSMAPYAACAQSSLVSAFMHDVFAALLLLGFMGVRGRLGDTLAALKTRSGRVVALGALLGGPIGMSGYLLAIDNIGAGYSGAISAFYPAVGTALAVLVLKERMSPRQVVALICALCGVMAMGWASAGADTVKDVLAGVAGITACVFGWGSEAVILAWGMRDDAVDNETALHIRETTSALAYGLVVMPLAGAYAYVPEVALTPANGVVLLAALAGVMSYLYYYKAIDFLGAARAMAFNISYSAWAVLLTAVVTVTAPSALEILCCVVIVCGTVLSGTNDWSSLLGKSSQSVGESE